MLDIPPDTGIAILTGVLFTMEQDIITDHGTDIIIIPDLLPMASGSDIIRIQDGDLLMELYTGTPTPG